MCGLLDLNMLTSGAEILRSGQSEHGFKTTAIGGKHRARFSRRSVVRAAIQTGRRGRYRCCAIYFSGPRIQVNEANEAIKGVIRAVFSMVW
jgi:hypothetical protein